MVLESVSTNLAIGARAVLREHSATEAFVVRLYTYLAASFPVCFSKRGEGMHLR